VCAALPEHVEHDDVPHIPCKHGHRPENVGSIEKPIGVLKYQRALKSIMRTYM
jgi:hypothetical protein